LFARQFPAEIRYSGISLSVQLAGVLGGGFAPMIATSLLAAADGSPRYVIAYLIGMGIVALLCTALMRSDPPRVPVERSAPNAPRPAPLRAR